MSITREPFSLLIAVYAGDKERYLERAFHSAVQEQTRRAAQVVVVRDGPLSADLDRCLSALVQNCPVPVEVVTMSANKGLARAMAVGLEHCRYDVVARMDADDVCHPERFERMMPLLDRGFDLVGSGLLEIGEDETVVLGRREPPTDPHAIATSARWHDPFNHPSVVFRRSAVARAGGYQELPLLEDYWLFARMILDGSKVANLQEPLVSYRVSGGAYKRRGGIRLLRAEVRLQWYFRRSGFTTPAQFVRNVVLRGGYRLVPENLRRRCYQTWIARRGPALDAARGKTQIGREPVERKKETIDADDRP